jgi:hypothetical protein
MELAAILFCLFFAMNILYSCSPHSVFAMPFHLPLRKSSAVNAGEVHGSLAAILFCLFFAMNIGASGAAASMGVAYGSGAVKKLTAPDP